MDPLGFRFHPYDYEIIDHYLTLKMNGHDSLVNGTIAEINLLSWEPWELPEKSLLPDDQVWYFYYRPDYKYNNNSKRANRTTNSGFWKPTGKVRQIKARRSGELIGTKRTLVFYRKGSDPRGTRTSWVIHEYQAKMEGQREFFLCKLKNKADAPTGQSPHDEGEPSFAMPSDVENHAAQPTLSQADVEAVLQSLLSGNVLQPQMQMEQGFLHEGLSPSNFFNNEPNRPSFQFDCSQEGVDPIQLADSFLQVPADEFYSEETAQTLFHGYRPPQSLRKVYVEDSSNTDTGVIHRESTGFMETSKQYQQMRMVQALTEALRSSNYERGGLGTQIQQVTKISKHQEPPKSRSLIKQEGNSPRKDGLQMSSPVSRDEARGDGNPGVSIKQGFGGMVSEKDKKTVQVTTAKPDVKLKSNVSAVDDKESSFIRFETPSSIHKSNPPSFHIFNVAVGVVLFIFFISELLVCH